MTTNTNTAPTLREKLIELIAGHLSGTYHCLRVWEAWHVGTMSQDDFEDVGESDTPAELAEAILAALASAAQQPTQKEPLTAREIELIDGMIEVQLHHANRCDNIGNRPMAEKQKGWDMERVELLKKLKASYAPKEPLTDEQIDDLVATASITERNLFRRFARAVEAAHGITAHKEAP